MKILILLLFLQFHIICSTKIGIAYSGGGITAMISSMCLQNSIDQLLVNQNYTVSTCSGGTLGYAIFKNVNNLNFPELNFKQTKQQLSLKNNTNGIWFGNVNTFLPKFSMETLYNFSIENLYGTISHLYNSYQNDQNTTNWWTNVMNLCFKLAYKHDQKLISGNQKWYAGFALVNKKSIPFQTNQQGVLKNAENHLLIPSSLEMNNLSVQMNDQEISITQNIEIIDAITLSTAFYSAFIFASNIQYRFLEASLIKVQTNQQNFYGTDGGFTDTTGIAILLKQQKQRIISFYINNNDLNKIDSPIASLFGVQTKTDTMNSLEGASLAQVFESQLYHDVFKNLTDPNILRVSLTNVNVLQNNYFGIKSYQLENLIIISNQFSLEFVQQYDYQTDILKELDSQWPNQIPIGMSTLEANLMCNYNQWKIQKYEEEIIHIFNK